MERGTSAAAAIVAGAGGLYGVFQEGTNTGGVPILLVVAAFFGYLAIAGQRLSSLRFDDNEAKFDRVVDRARDVLEDPDVPNATKSEVAEVLDAVREDLASSVRRSVDAVFDRRRQDELYEHTAITAVDELLMERARQERNQIRSYGVAGSNVTVHTGSGSGFVISAARAPRVGEKGWGPALVAVLNDFEDDLEVGLRRYMLFITDVVPEWGHGLELVNLGGVTVLMVQWNGPWDNEALGEALDRLIAVAAVDSA